MRRVCAAASKKKKKNLVHNGHDNVIKFNVSALLWTYVIQLFHKHIRAQDPHQRVTMARQDMLCAVRGAAGEDGRSQKRAKLHKTL